MKDELTLQDEFEALAKRCEKTQQQLTQADEDLKALIVSLTDADPKARPALVSKRGEAVNVRDGLVDELAELIRRRNIADLARYELKVTQAETELAKRLQVTQASKKAMGVTFDAMLHFQNSYRLKQNEETDTVRIKLETDKAKATAQSSIDDSYYQRARNQFEHAKANLEEARASSALPRLIPSPVS